MHDYAVFGHDRANIGRWLGFLAIVAAGGASQVLTWLGSTTGWEAFSKATVATGVVYLALHWLFNNILWKIKWFQIPNISGIWNINGQTLDENGNTKYEWPAKLDIEQNWKQISINIKTKSSQSQSYTATLSKRFGVRGGWILSYSYRNEPELEQSHELNSHKGFCELEIDKDLKIGKATYFNSNGRRTYGVMQLERENG
ncbi:hypothetical protein J8Z28_03870 [Pseudoalteromonas sp. SCSIO 43088]|uniref:Cap15 family cyclic dinucleotide receptor domain-containing protein n=1 Tax=Pseudoalteromonas sp. SCSIO 43088 TaxID=2822846 RepID=UPI00202B3B5D|nr:hypothetical protein [Pseudoalteromonas sp. SCSIO 43088]URQ87043.1 hypothetical protein J8Z28_03870 [Pseudoalteromonas sp. SCSIO 43088]